MGSDKTTNKELEKLMKINFSYPNQSDKDIQKDIYKKREFYGYKIKHRPDITNYEELKNYRDGVCARDFALLEHQKMLSNFINPNTPYSGVLIFHGLGTGKCCSKDTMVYINGNVKTIEDIWSEFHSQLVEDDTIKFSHWTKPSKNIYVNSYNKKDNCIINCPVALMFRQYVAEDLNEITLESGLTIRITKEHKLLSDNGWTNNLNVGDKIYVPKTCCNSPIPTNNMIPEFARLVAYLLKYNCVCFNDYAKIILQNDMEDDFITCFYKVIQYYNLNIQITRTVSKNYINISIRGLDILLSQLHCSKLIQIPDIIMNASSNIILTFLQVYFNNVIVIAYNKIIAHQLMYLLRLSNISSSICCGGISNDICSISINSDQYKQLQRRYTKNMIIDLDNTSDKDLYQKIITIKQVYYEDYVYDLNIPEHHNFVANGILCHNTCAAIAIAEKFKDQISKYGTKIHVLIPGPILKENWKNSLVSCTGSAYTKFVDKNVYQTKLDDQKNKNDAVAQALQYYRLMSYRSFYRKVLGEKIAEMSEPSEDGIKKRKQKYRKTEEGDYERELSVDRIHNLDNSLLIVDEAHNLTGNAYGDAVRMIIKNSKNLKVVLLSATPMKNLADDIIFLVNLLRPLDKQIERDMIFSTQKTYEMQFKEGGIEYLRDMVRGYVSHLRGADPLVFAKRVDIGIIPKSLIFTKIIPCKMLPFQQTAYDVATHEIEDALDRTSEAVSNFVFPGFSSDRNSLVGYFGKDGLVTVRNQLSISGAQLNNKLKEMLKSKDTDLITLSRDNKAIIGNYLHIDNLEIFSTKFYRALKNINKLVWGKKGAHTAFIYSNLVKVGIDVFKNVLLQNGTLEYTDKIQPLSNTKCYFCGIPYSEHSGKLSRKSKKKGVATIPEHQYAPTTFMVVTGKSSEDLEEVLPEENTELIKNVFNNKSNFDGRHIKYILGSKVINEGVSLMNVGEVHILDVYFNFGRVDQVVGRAIRHCSHYNIMTKDNPYPEVSVFKYAVVMHDGTPSSEEQLYSRCEQKHMLVKKVERVLKEEAIDCALNMAGNMFKEEMLMYKDCGQPGKLSCPSICDYAKCEYTCANTKLQLELYDDEKHIYRKLNKNEIDYTTFTKDLAIGEIEQVKSKIKELYLLGYVYTLESILDYVKSFYSTDKLELFDTYYVYKALDELIPITENDFNNFKDVVLDKYNRQGYLIFVNNFYIYQPFEHNVNIPMYIRTSYDRVVSNSVSLRDYLKHSQKDMQLVSDSEDRTRDINGYDFESTHEYYASRKEFDIVGIIDKEPNKKKVKSFAELEDVFKIREKKKSSIGKKRGVGIQTLTGTVCFNSQSKEFLQTLSKKLGIKNDSNTRTDICNNLRDVLLEREKYATDKDHNKITYVIIPANHQTLPFPYNLEDRVQYIINNINSEIKTTLTMNVSSLTDKSSKKPYYKITIKSSKDIGEYEDILKKYNAIKDGTNLIIEVR